ncbi:MAG: hypothetical protein AAGC55_00010 [Myxococcota bacterium]
MALSSVCTRLSSAALRRGTAGRAALVMSAVLAVFLGGSAPAAAHPPPFWWMGDLSGSSRAGFELGVGSGDPSGLDTVVVSAALFAEIAVGQQWTVLARLPFAYGRFGPVDGIGPDTSATALGNVQLGVQLADRIWRGRAVDLRLGTALVLSLPTASDEGGGAMTAVAATRFSLPDSGRYDPNTTTARLRGDVRIEGQRLFAQGEIAAEMTFRSEVPAGADDSELGLVMGVGAGVTLSPYYAVLAELTTISDILEDSDGENFSHVLDVGVRFHNAAIMAGFRVYVPVDSQPRRDDTIGVAIDVAGRF